MTRWRRILYAGVVLIAFAAGVSTGLAAGSMSADEQVSAAERRTWQATCYINQMDCSNIPRPLVVYSDTPEKEGLWGYYITGAPYIVLSDKIVGSPFSIVVMAHEYTHYIQFIQRKYAGADTDPTVDCRTEREAFGVGHIVASALELEGDDRVTTWDQVKDKYGCKE